MLGLIKKDLLMVKGNIKTFAIIFIVFTLMTINGNGDFAFIPVFISVMVMITTFSYDEYNKSDAYIASFPAGREKAVGAKYLATLLVMVLSVMISVLISFFIGYTKENIDIEKIVSTSVGCMMGVVLLQSILYPLIYKFGVEKSRIGIFVGVFGITGIASYLASKGFHIQFSENVLTFLNHYGMIIIPVILFIILFISYTISKYIYVKKEF